MAFDQFETTRGIAEQMAGLEPLQACRVLLPHLAACKGMRTPPGHSPACRVDNLPSDLSEASLGFLYGHMTNDPTAHYTPPTLAEPLVRHTLEPPGVATPWIVDPAMGCGGLLLEAAEQLAGGEDQSRRREVAAALHGMDLDAAAVEIARMTLWLFVGDDSLSPEEVAPNLRQGDSLFADWEWGAYDAVIANPPFAGKSKLAKIHGNAYIKRLQSEYDRSHGNADLCAFFVRLGARLIGRRGTMGFITTNTISQGDTRSTGLQRIVADGHAIYRADTNIDWPGDAAVVISVFHTQIGLDAEPKPSPEPSDSRGGACARTSPEIPSSRCATHRRTEISSTRCATRLRGRRGCAGPPCSATSSEGACGSARRGQVAPATGSLATCTRTPRRRCATRTDIGCSSACVICAALSMSARPDARPDLLCHARRVVRWALSREACACAATSATGGNVSDWRTRARVLIEAQGVLPGLGIAPRPGEAQGGSADAEEVRKRLVDLRKQWDELIRHEDLAKKRHGADWMYVSNSLRRTRDALQLNIGKARMDLARAIGDRSLGIEDWGHPNPWRDFDIAAHLPGYAPPRTAPAKSELPLQDPTLPKWKRGIPRSTPTRTRRQIEAAARKAGVDEGELYDHAFRHRTGGSKQLSWEKAISAALRARERHGDWYDPPFKG